MATQWDEFEPVTSESTPWDEFEPVDPPNTDRERRRVALLGEMAAVERERAPSDQMEEMLAWTDRPISPREGLAGVVNASGARALPGMQRLLAAVPEDLSTAQLAGGALALTQLPRGVQESLAGTTAGMATPLNVAFAAAGGGAGAIPKYGGAAMRGIAGGFGADMARHLPEQMQALGEAYEAAATPQEKLKILTDAATAIGMPAAALLGALRPNVRSQPPRIEGVMNAEEAAANRAAVNLAAPGTVRAAERVDWAAFEPEAPPMFQLGEMPFEGARRFGTTELAPVEVLPQSGRLGPIEILDEPRSLLERETRGKTSFGAEAPTLNREAIPIEVRVVTEGAREVGLTKSAAALEEVTRGENRMQPYRAPKEFTAERAAAEQRKAARASVEEGLTMPEAPSEIMGSISDVGTFPVEPPGMPTGTLSRLQRSRIQAGKEVRTNQRNNPPSPPELGKQSTKPKTTEEAFELGYNSRTPEGIASLETLKSANDTAKAEAKAAKADLNQRAALAQEGQLIDEALSMAKGEIAERKHAQEWLQKREGTSAATSVQEISSIAPDAGTARAVELGKSLPKDQIGALADAVKKAEADAQKAMEAADADPTLETLDAMSQSGTKAGLMKESLEGALGLFERKLDPEFAGPEGQAKFNALMEQKLAEARGAAPEAPAAGGIEAALEKLKFSQEMGGELRTNLLKDIPVAVWNGAIDAAILAVKAGRTLADGVELAIAEIRKQVNKFDEQRARDYFKTILAEETKPGAGGTKMPPGATTAPAGATTGTPGATAGAPSATPSAPPVIPSATPTPSPAGAGTPPGSTPPRATPPAPGAAPGRVTLDDIYQRFEPSPKVRRGVGEVVTEAAEAFRTGVSSKFRPLNKLAEDIAKTYGAAKRDVAGIFEQLKGSSGKAEADIYRFDKDVADVVKGSERDFNAYVMLRRSIDRLEQDAADIAKAMAGGTVKNLNRRSVSGYTIPELQAKLALLESKLGPQRTIEFMHAAERYQAHLDQALQQQVTSGRMPLKVYEEIKNGNQFYAPFKVMKYLEDGVKPPGSGPTIDTVADFTKAMVGIEDPNFKLGDMLAAARQSIAMSRILAEKNLAMREVSQLANLDTGGLFIQKAPKGAPLAARPKGMDVVNVLENGEKVSYYVDQTVADALHSMGPQNGALIARMAGGLFRLGATTFNIPFQVGNLLADIPRAALVSKYGINGLNDLVRFPLDFVQSFYAGISGNLWGSKNQLFLDFLDSGAAGTTIQRYLTPDAFEFRPVKSSAEMIKSTLSTVAHFADAIEQTSKILGVKRAMREEGVSSGKELAASVPEAITEIRRFSGSPDFGRIGKWTEQTRANLLYMFLNARVQGTVADMGRLLGRDGAGTAAKTWGRVGIPVGLATAAAYFLNNSEEYAEDFAKRPEQEKRNYWLIPKDKFITSANGEKVRDYWRIPKREIAKWTANLLEAGLDFAREKDPDRVAEFASTMLEELSPVNIQGDTARERLESVGASLNPMIKAPLELATGRDMYRHTDIVPDMQQKASPERQYKDRTPELFKTLAEAVPDVAPEFLRSPLMLENMTKNLTAGLLTQFLPRKPVEGRTALENTPLLQRFQAVPYTDSTDFDEQMRSLERESANEQLDRWRTAQKIIDNNKGAEAHTVVKEVVDKHGGDPKLAERVVDLWVANKNGITVQERRVLSLPAKQRAEWIRDFLAPLDANAKAAAIQDMAKKRIFTERVALELKLLSSSPER